MSVTVEPGYLRGYAGQLDAIQDGAWDALAQFCDAHCTNTTGLDGALQPARAAVDFMGGAVKDLLREGDTFIRFTAKDLRLAAEAYERGRPGRC